MMFKKKDKKKKAIVKASFQLVPKEKEEDLDLTRPILEKEEHAIVRHFWDEFEKNKDKNSHDFSIFFLRHYRNYLGSFKGLAFIGENKWIEDRRFRAHATAVTDFIDVLIECSDDPSSLQDICSHLYNPHESHTLSIYDFENFRDSFIEFLLTLFGLEFNPGASKAWKKLLTFGIRLIYENQTKPGFFTSLFS